MTPSYSFCVVDTRRTEQIAKKGAGHEEAAWTWGETAKDDLLRPGAADQPHVIAA